MSEAHKILILSIHQEMGEQFIADITDGTPAASTRIELESGALDIDVLAGDPRLNPTWDETVRKADGMILLARFLDVISLDKIKAIYRRLPSDKMIPLSVLLSREEGELDYKMSCPACGQKLWVRDADIGKRGRCPTCKKPFKLPSQIDLVRSQLTLPDTVPGSLISKNDKESCMLALLSLAKRLTGTIADNEITSEDNLKKQTMRVQINSDDV
jgi:hypothetical protein